MALETDLYVFADYVTNWLEANKVALGLSNVFYGDQDKIPGALTCCVEPNDKTAELDGIPRKTAVRIRMYVILYLDKVQSSQLNRREADQKIGQLETFLNSDRTLGERCIHCMVTQVESGTFNKEGTIIRAARLSFEITTREFLPQ